MSAARTFISIDPAAQAAFRQRSTMARWPSRDLARPSNAKMTAAMSRPRASTADGQVACLAAWTKPYCADQDTAP